MRVIQLLACGLFACSDAKMSLDAADESSMAAEGMDTGSAPSDGAEMAEEPAYWRMAGTLLVNDGVIQTELSFLNVTIVGDSGGELCSDGVGITASNRQIDVPEIGVQAWWRVTRTDPDETSCLMEEYPNPLPKPVFVGLGAMHPDIEAVLAGDPDYSQLEGSRLRSVYAAMSESSSVWVFGVAETTSEEEVEIDPITGGLSVDGNWKFEGLYSFPLTD